MPTRSLSCGTQVTGRGGRLGREGRTGERTAAARPSLGAVLNRVQLDHRQVEDLTRFHADHGRVGKVSSAPPAAGRDVGPDLIRHVPRLQPEPLTALLLAGFASGRPRDDFSAGLANPSLLGGFEEFREFFPSRASNSATRPAKAAISASRCASATSRSANSTSSCSSEGASGIAEHDGSTTKSTCLRGKSQHGQVKRPAPQPKISEPRRKGPQQLTVPREGHAPT